MTIKVHVNHVHLLVAVISSFNMSDCQDQQGITAEV